MIEPEASSTFYPVFFFDVAAATEIYTLSLHDALPISKRLALRVAQGRAAGQHPAVRTVPVPQARSEEHTSELQSRENLVCRLLLEKKKRPDYPLQQLYPYGHHQTLPIGPVPHRHVSRP